MWCRVSSVCWIVECEARMRAHGETHKTPFAQIEAICLVTLLLLDIHLIASSSTWRIGETCIVANTRAKYVNKIRNVRAAHAFYPIERREEKNTHQTILCTECSRKTQSFIHEFQRRQQQSWFECSAHQKPPKRIFSHKILLSNAIRKATERFYTIKCAPLFAAY